MRGGYRPGAGRKPGTGIKKIKSVDPEEEKSIRNMLSLKTKAKSKIFNDLLSRIKNGEKITLAEKNLMDVLSVELAAMVDGEVPKVMGGEVLTPLDYMLKVMNDPGEEKELRARMAQAAAPYCHTRKGEGAGKKEEKADRAKSAGAGKFSAGRAPLAVVK